MKKKASLEDEIKKIRVPRQGEVLGVVEQRLGFNKMYVRCMDKKIRVGRVPGRKRRLWVREGDLVLLQPWSVQGDIKADIIFRYTRTQAGWLRKKGVLKD
jgi:translation initiation factor 1A